MLAVGRYADAPPARPDDWSGLAIPAVPTAPTSVSADGPGGTDDGGPRRQLELSETVAYEPELDACANDLELLDDDDLALPLPGQLDPAMQRTARLASRPQRRNRPMSQYRLNLFIQPEHAKRLDELAAKKGVSKSSIVAAALASWLSPDAGDQREAAIAKRLDRLSRQTERMERDQNIQIETLALFIRYFLTISTPVPEARTRPAPRAKRASSSSSSSCRHLLRGRSLVRDVVEELHPDPMRMDDAAAMASADERAAERAS